MQKLLSIILLCLIPLPVFCWGFYGHRKINRMAVFTLPTELMGFYKNHIEFLTGHAVDPDLRRHSVKEEAPRHYIDIDHYGDDPLANVPRKWKDAVAMFSEDTLRAYGIVPWHVNEMYARLVRSFRERDIPGIIKTSADLGHYVADAHVPLHTTENYNGQLTGQHGIHGFWESRLPELFADDYDFFTGKARYIASPLDYIWEAVETSHAAVDSVLLTERELTATFPADMKYAFEERGNGSVKTYSKEFSAAYHDRLDGMVERRMRAAITAVGSLWYSAWLEAGKPILDEAVDPIELEELESERRELESTYRQNKASGHGHED